MQQDQPRKAEGEPPSDYVLFAEMRSDSPNALARLHERYVEDVYWAVYSLVQDHHETEEIVQDAFLLLWTKRTRIEVLGSSVLPWLLVTSRYLALNHLRAVGRDRCIELRDEASNDSPEDRALLREELALVEESVRKLSRLDRAIYQMCLVEGFSYKQAAYRLRVPHGTVRNRVFRVRIRLRADLTEHEAES